MAAQSDLIGVNPVKNHDANIPLTDVTNNTMVASSTSSTAAMETIAPPNAVSTVVETTLHSSIVASADLHTLAMPPSGAKAAVALLTVNEDATLPKATKAAVAPLTFPFASIAVKPIGLTTSLSATAKTPPASSAQEQTSFKTPTNTASDTVLAEGFFEEDPENEPFTRSLNGRSPPCQTGNARYNQPKQTPTVLPKIVDDRSPSTPTNPRGNPIKNGKGGNKGRPSTPGRGKQNNSQRSPEQQEISPSSLPTNQRLRLSDNSPSNA